MTSPYPARKSIKKLQELVRCPIDWVGVTRQTDAATSILVFDWYHCWRVLAATHYEDLDDFVDPEEEDLIQAFVDHLDGETMQRLIGDITSRRSNAEQHHSSRAGRLSRLTFLRPSQHGKHFKSGLDQHATIRESKGEVSYFFEDEPAATLQTMFWSWFFRYFMAIRTYDDYIAMLTEGTSEFRTDHGKIWRSVIDRNSQRSRFRVVAQCLRPIGASRGEATNLLCFDVQPDANNAHAFPITLEDSRLVLGGKAIAVADELNF
ncbi:MAG: hypothetical protein WBQ85_10005 [Candidatus Sulfotelmatobacter sp.]